MFSLFSFYRSKEWETLRDQLKLSRVDEHGDIICEHCGKPIVKKYDCICHHKICLTEQNVNDWDISLNPDNIALVHHRCHNEIHERFGTFNRHVYIVYGSPCAGKSFYVDSVANKNDYIIDIDRIYSCISNGNSRRMFDNVMGIYRAMIDDIKTRNGRWCNAFIVRGFPMKSERERLASSLNAELIFIDTPKNVCLERSIEKGVDYYKVVEDWWQKYRG